MEAFKQPSLGSKEYAYIIKVSLHSSKTKVALHLKHFDAIVQVRTQKKPKA